MAENNWLLHIYIHYISAETSKSKPEIGVAVQGHETGTQWSTERDRDTAATVETLWLSAREWLLIQIVADYFYSCIDTVFIIIIISSSYQPVYNIKSNINHKAQV